MKKLIPMVLFLFYGVAHSATTIDVLYVFDDAGFDPAVDTLAADIIDDMTASVSDFIYNVTLEDDDTYAARSNLTGIELVIFAGNCVAADVDAGPDITNFSGGVVSMFFGSTTLNTAMGLGAATLGVGMEVRYNGADTTYINRREMDSLRAFYRAGGDGSRGKINISGIAANADILYTDSAAIWAFAASIDSGVSNAAASTNHGPRVFMGTQSVSTGFRDWGSHAPFRRDVQRSVAWAVHDTTVNSWPETVIWIGFAEEMGNGWNEIGNAANCIAAGPNGESFDSSIFTSVEDFLRFGGDGAFDPVSFYDPVGIDSLVPEGKRVDSAFLRLHAWQAGIDNDGDSFNISTGLFPILANDSNLIAPFYYEEPAGGGCPEDWKGEGGRLENGVSNRYGKDENNPWDAKNFTRGTDIPSVPWDSVRWSWDGSTGSVPFDTALLATNADTMSFRFNRAGMQDWVDNVHKGFILKLLVRHGGDVEGGPNGDRWANKSGTSNTGTLLYRSGIEIFLSQIRIDSTPSVNAFNLAYNNNGVLDSADGVLLGMRFDAIVFEIKWTAYASGAMVGYKVQNPDNIMLEYNSFQDNFVSGPVIEDRFQHAALLAFLGADSNLAYYMFEDSTIVNRGSFASPNDTFPGVSNNTSDSSLSRIPFGSTSNNNNRRLAWYEPGIVTDAYIDYYLNLLDNPVESVAYDANGDATVDDSIFWSGIWHDNVGVGGQSGARTDTSIGIDPNGGKVAALNSFKFGGDMGADLYPYYFDSIQLPFLTEFMDSLKIFSFADGNIRYLANNFAEVRADITLNSGGAFQFHDSMTVGSIGDFAFWELDFKLTKNGPPNLLSDGLASSGTQWTSGEGDTHSPIFYWERDSMVYANGGASWWWPRFTDPRPYGVQNWHYSNLAVYYMLRSPVDWIAPNQNTTISAALLGTVNDTLDWCPAYTFNFGDTAEFTTVGSARRPFKMVGSVQCLDCIDTVGLGKDELGENWLLFAKDFPNGNKVIIRPSHSGTSGFGTDSTNYTAVFQLGGTFTKLLPNGTQTGNITEDSLRSGEGGIYIAQIAASTGLRVKVLK